MLSKVQKVREDVKLLCVMKHNKHDTLLHIFLSLDQEIGTSLLMSRSFQSACMFACVVLHQLDQYIAKI